ncbi:MAG TPA: hypothetical protein PK530_01035 [Anaerolineales bacterium]|nr:hypothetical protein [Anaerolineales bacterium]
MNPAIHAAIAAAHAAERNQKQQEEEERMTRYNPDELESDWEFKIVRSSTPIFRKPEVLRQVREEESLAGWTLLEKLDDLRLRFKRPTKAGKRDDQLPAGIDPYRTQIGGSDNVGILIIAISIPVFLTLIIFLVSRFNQMGEPIPAITILINVVVTFIFILVPLTITFVLLRGRK